MAAPISSELSIALEFLMITGLVGVIFCPWHDLRLRPGRERVEPSTGAISRRWDTLFFIPLKWVAIP